MTNNDLPEINQRLWFLIEHFSQGNFSDFSRILHVKNHNQITRLFRKDSKTSKYPLPSADIIFKIAKHLVEVDLNWLINGEGKFIKPIFQSAESLSLIEEKKPIIALVESIFEKKISEYKNTFETLKLISKIDGELIQILSEKKMSK